ncbi:MAG: apolipoprotein N-acyltransferase [Armatimonadetes bacterium]|nr:apolipoprotein N-acyltransferase [Armatimonadota bacterium]
MTKAPRYLLIAAAGGLLFGLDTTVTTWGALSCGGLALLGLSLRLRCYPCLCALLWSVVAYSLALGWMLPLGAVPWILLVVWHILFLIPLIGAAHFVQMERQPFASALALGGLIATADWLRELGPFGVTMAASSGPLSASFAALQWVRLIGATGLGFAGCTWAIWLGLAVAERSSKRLMIGPSVAAAFLVAGLWLGRTATEQSGTLRVAVLQGVTSDGFRTLLEGDAAMSTYQRLSTEAARDKGAKLILWPETSCPEDMTYKSRNYRILSETFNDLNAWGLVGGFVTQPGLSGEPETRNAAFAFDPEGELAGVYEKMVLTPFGEYVPFRHELPSLKRWRVLDRDYAPGRYWPPVEIANARVGVLICSETMYSRLAAERVRQGATILAVLSNDSWFGKGSGVLQLERLSVLRAVETGRSVARASETGKTMLITANGRIMDSLPLYRRGLAVGDLPISSAITPFVRIEAWIGPSILVITLTALIVSVLPLRKARVRDAQLRLPLDS